MVEQQTTNQQLINRSENTGFVIGEVEGTALKVGNWNKFKVLLGKGKSPIIFNEFEHRRRTVKQNMIVIVGAPGTGKSYLALRLAEILDKKFNPHTQIVFERSHLLWLLGPNSPLKMGQVIMIDEAQFIAGARRWYEDIQKDVMEHMEAVRSRGFIIIIVALHLGLLDKILRKYVLSHMMLMRDRGKAIVYTLFTPPFIDKLYRKALGNLKVQLPSFEYCKFPSCLICAYIDRCLTNRAIYERNKRDFLARMSLISQQKAAQRERRQRVVDYNDLLQKVIAKQEQLVFTASGKLESESVKLILEREYGITIQDSDANKLIKRGKILYPSVFVRSKMP